MIRRSLLLLGFAASGDGNEIRGSSATDSESRGFFIFGIDPALRGVRADGNAVAGVGEPGTNTVLEDVREIGNGP